MGRERPFYMVPLVETFRLQDRFLFDPNLREEIMFFNILIDQQFIPHAKNGDPQKEKKNFLRHIGQIVKIGLQIVQPAIDLLFSLVQLDSVDKAKLDHIHQYQAF